MEIAVTEAISITDSAAALPPRDVSITETITVTDSARALPPVTVAVAEPIAVGDSVAALPPVSLSVTENITVTDAARALPPLALAVVESVTVAEAVSPAPDLRAGFDIDTLRGSTRDTLALPLRLTGAGSRLGTYELRLTWSPADYVFVGAVAGPATAELTVDDGQRSQGTVVVTGTGAATDSTRLLDLRVRPDTGAAPDDTLEIGLQVTRLTNDAGHDLIPYLTTADAALCVGDGTWGDATGDGRITAADATVVLRAAAGIEPGPDVDLSLADVDDDGSLTAEDASLIAQWTAGLAVDAPVGAHPVSACTARTATDSTGRTR